MATANKTNKAFGNRKFYSLPEDYALRAAKPRASAGVKKPEDTAKLLKYIDDNVIGKNATFASPFGRRKVVYCDYTASGRSLQFLEDYILKEVLPSYGNTHTTTSITSLQSTLYRHEARDIFRNAVNASEHDAVIFAGHGCTGAVHKLVHALSLPAPPVVFVGPAEHHSNLLPWRELGATMVRVSETRDGQLDLAHLEAELQSHYGQGRQLIGCFSAASNVTGILVDDVAATALLHRYGALAFWDFAAAAPYVKIDMNPADRPDAAKDAVFFSVHKFVGGVQTPGVLVAKKALFRNAVPDGCGGGSVFFVSRDSHRYLQDTELREEGGTAAVVESVRAGLAMQLKEAVGEAAILAREEKVTRTFLAHCRTIPELVVLGPTSGAHKRLPIFSFMVKHPRGTFLHHNFVCMVLNDVFGIQARGGCACAGPYAQDLLGIDADLAQAYETALLEDSRLDRTHLRRHEEHSSYEMLRPGFARLSLPYFMSDAELAFVLEALKMVATEGWKLLPQYIVNPETGEWRHHTNLTFKERKWLGAVRYVDGKMCVSERRVSGAGSFPPDYAECLRTARGICNRARKMAQRCPLPDQNVMFEGAAEHLRWFMLPSEAQDLLLGHSQNVKTAVPFDPSQPQTPRQLSPRHSQQLAETQRPQSPGVHRLSIDTRQACGNSPCDSGRLNDAQRLAAENTDPQRLLTQCNLNPNSENNSQRLLMDSLDPQRFLTRCSLTEPNLNDSHRLTSENMVPQPLLTQCHSNPNALNDLQRLSIDSLDNTLQLLTQCSLTQTDLTNSQRLSVDSPHPQNLFTQCHTNPSTVNNLHRSSLDNSETQQLLVSPQCQLVDMQGRPLDLQRHSFDAQQLLYSGQQLEAQRQSYQTNSQCYQPDQGCRPNPSRQFLSAQPSELSRSLSHSPVHFVLGDPTLAPRFAQLPRERCFSLGADASFSLPTEMGCGGDETLHRDGSSQTELDDVDRCRGRGPRHSSSADAFFGDSTVDGISAYVREMTKDLATEIKSEIREVISQVEDVLSETQDADHHDRAKPAGMAERRDGGGSVSVNSVMDYLMECSREMASEVKHEIRSAVEVLNSPDTEHHLPAHARLADLAHSSDGSSDETVSLKCRPASSQGKAARVAVPTEAKAEDTDTEDGHTLSAENKQCALMRSAINSISSQDSGINLMFPESDNLSTASQDKKPRKRKLNLSISSPADNARSAENARSANGARGSRWHYPPKAIWKPAVEALHEFDMIRDGDRVLVCLSGGKDSLSLLHTLRQFQFYARSKGVDFALGAATVDPGSSAYDPRPLIPYLAALGVPYLYEEQPILEQAAALPNACSSVCSFCSRMKRGRLYAAARANGYNVLALGQHLDDLVESFFMSAFHNGRLRSMKAHYLIRERDLRVIRPLVYVREKALRQFAESRNLPVIAENCPACFEAPKERFRSKQLLAQQEVIFPKLFWSLRTALHPLICFRKTGEEALAFSRQHRAARALALAQPQEGSDTDEEEA